MTMAAPPNPFALPPALAVLMPGQTKAGASGDGGAAAAVFIGLLQQLSGPAIAGLEGARGDSLSPDGESGPDQAAATPGLAMPGVNLLVLAPTADGLRPDIGAEQGVDNNAQPPLTVTAKLAPPAQHMQPLAMRPLPLTTATAADRAPSSAHAPALPGKMDLPPFELAARVPAVLPEVALDAPIGTASRDMSAVAGPSIEPASPAAAGPSIEPVPPAAALPAVAMPTAPAPTRPAPFAQPLPSASAPLAAHGPEQPAAGDPGQPQGAMTPPLPIGTTDAPVAAPQEPVPHASRQAQEEPPASEPAPARAGEAGARQPTADVLNPVNLMKTAEGGLVLVPREPVPGPGTKPAPDAARPGAAKRTRPLPVTAFAEVQPDTAGRSGSAANRFAARLGLAQGAERGDGPASHFAPVASGREAAAGQAPHAIAGTSAAAAETSMAPAPRLPLQMPAAPPAPTAADPQPLPQSLAAALDPARMGLAADRIEPTGLLQAAQAGPGLERAGTAQPAVAPQPAPQTGHPPAAQQLGLALQYRVGRGETRFALRLDPPELGRIEVALKLHGDGRVDALVKADHGHTLDLLQRDGRILERAFHQLGLKPEGGIQFTTGQGGQHHGQQAFAEGGLSGQHHGNGQPAAQEDAAAMTPAAVTGAAGSTDDILSEEAAGTALREAVIGVDVKV